MQELQVIDDDQMQLLLALEAPRPGPQARDGQRRRVVDVKRQAVQLLAGDDKPIELVGSDIPAADRVGRNPGLLGQDPHCQLFG